VNNENPILKLTKSFDSCPNCGSTKRLAVECARHNDMPSPEKASIQMQAVPLKHPLVPSALVVAYDVCLDCGTMYATNIVEQPVKIRAGPMMNLGGNDPARRN